MSLSLTLKLRSPCLSLECSGTGVGTMPIIAKLCRSHLLALSGELCCEVAVRLLCFPKNLFRE